MMGSFMASSLMIVALLVPHVLCQYPRWRYNRGNGADDLVLANMADDITGRIRGAEPDLPQMLQNMGLTSLYNNLEQLALTDALRDNAPLTVFGPTNEAFNNLRPWTRERMRNTTVLSRTLQYHVVPGRISTADMQDEQLLDTLIDKSIRINIYPKRGRGPRVYTAQCKPLVESMTSSNGVVHSLNHVLLPPYGALLESLTACPYFSNLTAAISMVGLDTRFSGPITLFAPTDYVFQRAFPQGLDAVFRNMTALRDLVYSHVISGTYCSAGLDSGMLRTLSGRMLRPVFTEGDISINGVRLMSTDAMVSDGVVHCVDAPLWP